MRTRTQPSPVAKAPAIPRGPAPRPRVGSPAAVRHILHAPSPQPKLTVGAPDDAFEHEADQVADQVMRMPEPGIAAASAPPRVQRMCTECEEEKKDQGVVQRMCADCEEEQVRAKEEPGQTPEVPSGFAERFAALHGQELPAAERSFFEPRFGRDFASVRLHSGPAASELARSVHARAFTLGDSIVFGSGQYAPGTSDGRELMAHELTHVVQQGGGAPARVQRVVSFRADFSNISVASRAAAAIPGESFTYEDAAFSADADVTAIGDTEAELDEWDVGLLQDMVPNWEREYWLRDNADGRGRFVEQKFRPIMTPFRDQVSGSVTEWYADSEHSLVSGLAKTPRVGGGFEASTTISHSDNPGGSDRRDGSDVAGMDASDGERNIRTQRIGSRFDTWVSAHNTVTSEWRHLRWLNWNYQRSLDFTGLGPTLAVGPESGQVGRHGPYDAGGKAPLTAGTTANTAVNDAASWRRRRVNGWT
ncbi:MAG TPA: DUF4157 domain-containing protein [Thermoanaerobaculia bacterium]|jgi:hypothetical protein|nr:DUF4157 domain-containing protein [Thermoanaerobaculia bacterium]